MKLIREHINEKFTAGSDPISDMGIGIFGPKNFKNEKEFYDFLNKNLHYISKINEIPKIFIMHNDAYTHTIIKTYYFDAIKDYIDKYVTINGKKITNKSFNISRLAKLLKNGTCLSTKEDMENAQDILSEKFLEDSDPISDMGIGIVNKIFKVSKEFYAFKAELYSEIEWKKIINWLLKKNYKPWEILAILDNKVMRYASDASGVDKATLNDFEAYNDKCKVTRGESEIVRILKNYKTFQPDYIDVYKSIAKRHGIFNEIQEQSISEKFTTDSDPISDMGIGYFTI